MQKIFEQHIENSLKFLKNSKLILAVSGGLDSVVLTHLCREAGFNMAVAHCNFKLRAQASDDDAEFVSELAKKIEVESFEKSFETELYAKKNKLSIQMAARELRYNWFEELSTQEGFDYILTAHHLDDSLETFIINLSRGTGLKGLTGIPEINDAIVRPLLIFSRKEIETFAKSHKLQWREDESNASTKYLRNKIRHEIVPRLIELTEDFYVAFSSSLRHLKGSQDIVEDTINEFWKSDAVDKNHDVIRLKIDQLKNTKNISSYLFELLHPYGFTEWDDVINLLDAQSGKQVLSPTHRLIKDRDNILLASRNESDETLEEYNIAEHTSAIDIPVSLLLEDVTARIETNNTAIYLDKNMLKFPLTLRKWKNGDYFYPTGIKGKKKLSKYFKDEKLSLLDKEKQWLLCSGDDIVWIVGRRQDRRYKCNKESKQIIKITLQE